MSMSFQSSSNNAPNNHNLALQHQVQNLTGQLVNGRFLMAEAKLKLESVLRDDGAAAVVSKLETIANLLVDENEKISPTVDVVSSQGRLEKERKLEMNNEIIDLKNKIKEYQQDLVRDEEIFAAKSRDMKLLQKQLHRETVKNNTLTQTVAKLESEVDDLKSSANDDNATVEEEKVSEWNER